MFDAISISMVFGKGIEAEPVERTREMLRAIDEERPLLDLLFVAEFAQEQHGELCRPRLKQP